jgi:flagellar assembly protein FliH
MSSAKKFMFATDFRAGGRQSLDEADLAAAKAEAFQAGEAQARQDAEAQLSRLAAQLARSAERLLAQDEVRTAAVEEQAVQVAIATAKGLAGAALAIKPLAEVERAVRECLSHARLAPHLLLRVHEGAVEAAEILLKRLAHENGFAGRLVVLGDPVIAPGDGRIEWADGGFSIESERMAQLVQQAVLSVFPAHPSNPSE